MSVKEIKDKLQQIKNLLASEELSATIGEEAKDRVYSRTKAGKGVTSDEIDNPKEARLKGLSSSYKNQRKKKNLGQLGSPGRSNLTLTGDMLESIKVIKGRGKVKVIIPNSARGDGKTNKQILEYTRKERPFFALTDKEKKIITEKINKFIRQKVKDFFK